MAVLKQGRFQEKTIEMIANTHAGPVRGREKDGVALFAGIPYAAPPLDDLRFVGPQPLGSWSEPRDARKFGPAAPQIASGGMTDAVTPRWSEDCLTLNIATAALTGSRPVLFWIHGGGYRTGQGAIPWYNGARFAANGDIVVVSINYRLGALGFTDLSRFGERYATSGVNGTLDQIAALMWVRDNIAGFGGDPKRVTIAGESAGGFSVATLLGSPRAQGLFRAAIPQSGAAHHTLPPEAGQRVTDCFLDRLDATSIEELLVLPVEEILDAQLAVISDLETGAGFDGTSGLHVSPFYPITGNDVLPESPLTAISAGMGSDIPVLTGSNLHETTLWGYGEVDEAKLTRMANDLGAANVLGSYRIQHPEAAAQDLAIAITTDHMFRIPAIRLAEAREPHGGNTWMYLFCWQSRAFDGHLKATHALEIPFAFDNLDKAGVDAFLGPGDIPQGVADTMHQAWTRFIRDQDPGWAAYTSATRTTMRFDTESRLVNDPGAAERRAWEGLR
ncbi:MAG: carboxylesterase/lipase family protein [Pseudomonadales bacterium]|nr:carboxylesterase/lipase family protein [Pseudomonadales bacterium]MDP6471390.1 carboxylesterase/lipase family protein [Pseudomonadales bacterium]MDP6826418.1 carboxylesterase/lipase family protein [Pseudomonadales bacterium]MDP6970971.1 carboxylesterase/lipase family protein [Pseudomonadales bacterium]